MNRLAGSLAREKRYSEAESLALSADQVMQKTIGPSHATTLNNIELLVSIYADSGRPAQAAEWRAKLSGK